MTTAVEAMRVGGWAGHDCSTLRIVPLASCLALAAIGMGPGTTTAASPEPPAVVYESPCVPGGEGATMLHESGLRLDASSRLFGDHGEQLELWHSPDGRRWAAVVYLEEGDVRCLVSGAGMEIGSAARLRSRASRSRVRRPRAGHPLRPHL
jgi:hypothetical protein